MGRPWPKPGEPLFLEDDTNAALEYFEEQALLCSGCGLPRDETMAHESEGHKYKARVLVCHACRERDLKAKEHTRGEHDDAGLMFAVEPID